MRKYRNFIIITILSGIVGGFVGAFSEMGISFKLDLGNNPRLFAFKVFLVLGIIMLAAIVVLIIDLVSKLKKIDLDDISNGIDKEINNLLYMNTMFVILSLTWMAVMVSKSFGEIEGKYLMASVLSVVISSMSQSISIMIYNKYYPSRKLNMYENNSDKNYFNKLDEGEKWIVYSCAYSTFQNMQLVYSIVLIIALLLSVFITISILLPIVIGLLWIVQVSIYSIKANKYNKEDV